MPKVAVFVLGVALLLALTPVRSSAETDAPSPIQLRRGWTEFVWSGPTTELVPLLANAPATQQGAIASVFHWDDTTRAWDWWRAVAPVRLNSLRELRSGDVYWIRSTLSFALQPPAALPSIARQAMRESGVEIIVVGRPSRNSLEGIGHAIVELLEEDPSRAARMRGVRMFILDPASGDPADRGFPGAAALASPSREIRIYELITARDEDLVFFAAYVMTVHEFGHIFDFADGGGANASLPECAGINDREVCASQYSGLYAAALRFDWRHRDRIG